MLPAWRTEEKQRSFRFTAEEFDVIVCGLTFALDMGEDTHFAFRRQMEQASSAVVVLGIAYFHCMFWKVRKQFEVEVFAFPANRSEKMRIFISSTFRDLRAERDAAVEALRRIGLVPWGMELFVSEPTTPLQVALDELQMSDAVVLIIGFKAGSLIPDDSTLTYTGAEFQRAQELGKPIFVFLKTETGAWLNEETSAALKEALDKFKQAVLDSGITPAYFDSSDRLQIELLLAIEKWNAQGRPGSRLVFTTREEFFAPYQSATPRLFDFNQTLRGRDSEIQALNQFLATPQQIVGVLTGRGGIGKSKLLHDWTGSVSGAKILYVREDADWHPEAAKEIPTGDVVIVVDDAHRLTFLDRLLIAVRDLQGKRSLKLVLGTRPSGTGLIDAELAAPGWIRARCNVFANSSALATAA